MKKTFKKNELLARPFMDFMNDYFSNKDYTTFELWTGCLWDYAYLSREFNYSDWLNKKDLQAIQAFIWLLTYRNINNNIICEFKEVDKKQWGDIVGKKTIFSYKIKT